ncbi:hypothetical protein [uncultured Flavobacterium sp.]|uniref:hypothetical protein n=1 Tax=uncultured Flavobacterium sp. TaxID=165435 RepID=UPI0025E88D51|nr:hypothetical protein [uncultured Flavobacterium sp.]
MALSGIEVKIIGYYIWDEYSQSFHENNIENFKYYFKKWLENLERIPKTINVNINVNYDPAVCKFEFTFISTRENEIVQALKDDCNFSDRFFVNL